ncbi:LytR/AlgR family response regulator transcription factor [Filimonas effusa]|uniref:Response regulator transcription factor n=1 Tax=Filimonas effusa TaxID=2508721 RepID=A0A4Q1DAA5_9BACT|nr:LytTR family DNA-binding domain-containing protein [Filimonas effusa]RXK85695.1 response regulator transcription factor [Filimonas effusa]
MNILVVEDESHTADLLKEVIEQQGDFIVVNILDSIVATVAYLIRHHDEIDLIFLDIQLSDGLSFEIFKYVDVHIPVIFCTAYDEYTLQAIKNNGIDYILKPFEEEEVCQALKKYRNLLNAVHKTTILSPLFPPSAGITWQESFLVQQREKTIVVETTAVAAFAIEHEMLYLYTFKGEKYPLFKKMDYLESAVNPALFFRINRQMLVNKEAITSMEPWFNRKMILNLKVMLQEKAIVSRLKVSLLKEWLEKGVG